MGDWRPLDRAWKETQDKSYWAGAACRQLIVKGKLDHGQPTRGRQLEDMESKCACSRDQTFPGAVPNAPVMPKILIGFEMLGFATLLPRHQDFSSALHLPEHHGLSFVSACKEGLLLLFYLAECSQISWKKHQINTIMIAIFIIRYDSASITMRSTSNWIGAHCTFRVQTPGIWCSWELNRFLTILYIAEKSFSSPSVFLFYLTDLWTSISPNFLFLGVMK